MGKIIKNGITYGVDESAIKSSIIECTLSTHETDIVGVFTIKELNNKIEEAKKAAV